MEHKLNNETSDKNPEKTESMITAPASEVTNGRGGGAIIENGYGVYSCGPGRVGSMNFCI